MSEFDFDELDRAVSSLMKKAAPEQVGQTANDQPEKTTREAFGDASKPAPVQAAVESVDAPASVKVFTPSSAARKDDTTATMQKDPAAVSSSAPSETEAATVTDPVRRDPTQASAIHQRFIGSASRPLTPKQDQRAADEYDAPVSQATENSDTISSKRTPSEVSAQARVAASQSQTPTMSAEENSTDDRPRHVIPHRTGRFMDMKPTSVMAKKSPLAPPSKRPTHAGVTIAPRHSAAPVMDAVKPEATDNGVDKMAEAPNETHASFTEPAKKPTFDFSLLSDPEAATKEQRTEQAHEATDAADEPAKTHDEPESKAPTTLGQTDYSAFLTDAKPEKRPLGGGVTTDSTVADEVNEAPATQTSHTVKQPAIHEEFNEALMAIESGDIEKSLPAGEPEKLLESGTGTKTSSTPVVTPAPSMQMTPVRPQGPISIPKQYDEQPSTGPEDNGAIFDTATYHQPLEHPAKKSHGWVWVLLIVLVIALGAGIGAALYLGYL